MSTIKELFEIEVKEAVRRKLEADKFKSAWQTKHKDEILIYAFNEIKRLETKVARYA
jgi:hypothetical protein